MWLFQEDESREGILSVGKAEFGPIGLDLVWMETNEDLKIYLKNMDNRSQSSPGIMDLLGHLQRMKLLSH